MNSSFSGDALSWHWLHKLLHSFSMLLLNISPRGASEAKERTISVGSVLLVVPLGCFCTPWPWCQNCLPWAEFPCGPCMPLGEPCFTLVCKWRRRLQKTSWQPKQRPSANTHLTQPVTHTVASIHEINDLVITPQMTDFRQQLDVGNLGSPSDSR